MIHIAPLPQCGTLTLNNHNFHWTVFCNLQGKIFVSLRSSSAKKLVGKNVGVLIKDGESGNEVRTVYFSLNFDEEQILNGSAEITYDLPSHFTIEFELK